MISGSFTHHIYAYSPSELCEAWANHASTPWKLTDLYNAILSVGSGDLAAIGTAIFNYSISNKTSGFVDEACRMDPDMSEWKNARNDTHGGHGGYWGRAIKSADDDNKNGTNKNYYLNPWSPSSNNPTMNYSPITYNSDDDIYNINYTYEGDTYNYSFSNSYYTTSNNSYVFDLTNNTQMTMINNYNSTKIIYEGNTTDLYYMLPDGTNSYNLTEEQAKNGYKTSLSVGSYENRYDSADLQFLYHFDHNEYDSAYPVNSVLSFSKNSVNYVQSGNFNSALALEGSSDINVNRSGLYVSFRFYPIINDHFSLAINGTDIFERQSQINTTYDYVEWQQNTSGTSETVHGAGSAAFTVTITSGSGTIQTSSFPSVSGYTATYGTTTVVQSGKLWQRTAVYSRVRSTDETTISTSTNQRTYNIINNKLFLDTGSNLVNYGMWNFVSILMDGSVYINGVDSGIDIDNTQNLVLSFDTDGVFYFDELFGNSENRSVQAPSIPYDSNINYYLPNEFENNKMLIQSLIRVNGWRFGGFRPSVADIGFVYSSTDEVGNITSVQQYNGIEWVSVNAGIYNDYLGIWVNAIGFNIFNNNWDYQDLNYQGSDDNNVMIKFLTKQFNRVVDAINNIKIDVTNQPGDTSITNDIENKYDIDTDLEINNYIDDLIDADNDINLQAPEFNLPDLQSLQMLSEIPARTIKIFTDNNLGFMIYLPIIILILGLVL